MESKAQIPEMMQCYERIRKERILKIREETFKQQEELHLADGESQRVRDEMLAKSFNTQDSDNLWLVTL